MCSSLYPLLLCSGFWCNLPIFSLHQKPPLFSLKYGILLKYYVLKNILQVFIHSWSICTEKSIWSYFECAVQVIFAIFHSSSLFMSPKLPRFLMSWFYLLKKIHSFSKMEALRCRQEIYWGIQTKDGKNYDSRLYEFWY